MTNTRRRDSVIEWGRIRNEAQVTNSVSGKFRLHLERLPALARKDPTLATKSVVRVSHLAVNPAHAALSTSVFDHRQHAFKSALDLTGIR
jgi:hypothetical protein